jgi:hypothetical protein
MGQALSSALRLEIVQARQDQKLSYQALANRFKVHYHTVRNLCIAYTESGEAALVPDYSACGRPINKERGLVVFVVFDPLQLQWICMDQHQKIIKTLPDPRFSPQNLYNLNICQ